MSSPMITPKFRVSYPHLFKARAVKEGDKPKFQLTALFTDNPEMPNGSNSLAELKKAALDAALEKWGATDDTKKRIKSGKIRMPFITPDADDLADGKIPEDITLIIRMNSPESSRPGVVDRFPGPDGRALVITDPDVVYPGCYARASIRAFAYDRPDSKGVTFALNNVQKLGEGTRFDGRRTATDEFDVLDAEPAAMAEKTKSTDPMGLDDL